MHASERTEASDGMRCRSCQRIQRKWSRSKQMSRQNEGGSENKTRAEANGLPRLHWRGGDSRGAGAGR